MGMTAGGYGISQMSTSARQNVHVTRNMATIARATATLIVALAFVSCGQPNSAAPSHLITLTLIRHAESAGNVSPTVDTSVPGPGLTNLGRAQAQMAANRFSGNHYDGVFASTMIRTQETAEYMAKALDKPIEVLPGLREIEAGIYEGKPQASAAEAIFTAAFNWLDGHRDARIPGSIDGNEFDARFDDAVESIYESGDHRPVAFSHGGAIAVWTLMNVENPPIDLLRAQPLPNTGYVVIEGDPADGWTLLDWNGTKP